MAPGPLDQPQSGDEPVPAPAAVIQSVVADGSGEETRLRPILLFAWIISGVLHATLLFLLLLITINATSANLGVETEVVNTRIDDETAKTANLENEELGLDPNELLNYSNKRIKEESVPGPASNEPAGIENMPEAPPMNIPPPPGLGGSDGQGGAVDAAKSGFGNVTGLPGGMHGIYVPGGFGGRAGSTREELLREGGGNTESEQAVAIGQRWLVQHQAADGHWSLDGFDQHGRCNCRGFGINNDIAATAFGLLPLLGAGETHRNPKALYRSNVDRGLKYLVLKQRADGDFGGGMYAHGLATIAVCEAYGMTSDPALKGPAQRAIDFIRTAQSESGGWRYEPREGGDTSVVGWQVMALKSGQMAGLAVDDNRNPTFVKATRWLNSCMKVDGGTYSYQPSDRTTPTMTAVGLLCRLYLGTGTRDSGIRTGVERLKRTPPPAGLRSIYYYYYATQVLHHVGGPDWEFWNKRIRPMLVSTQDKGNTPKHPHLKGSWPPAGDVHGGSGGRVMTTSLAVLTLEVYYRHLPLYRRDLGGSKMAAN